MEFSLGTAEEVKKLSPLYNEHQGLSFCAGSSGAGRRRGPAALRGASERCLSLSVLVAFPEAAEAAPQPCWRGQGWEMTGWGEAPANSGGEGAQAKWGKGGQAVNFWKDVGAGRRRFNLMFVPLVPLELML